MRFDRLITLGLVKPIGRVLGRFPAFDATPFPAELTLPVLMYHSISNDPEPAFSPYYKICTSPKRFAEHMQWLADADWRGVTLSEGLKALTTAHRSPLTTHSSDKLIAITFDDGFRDFQTEAFPVLRRHGFSATMYLPTAYIGDERKNFKGHECLTWSEVRQLSRDGIEFGSHTVTHPKLVELEWPQIIVELKDSKATIEQKLGLPVRSFAYPYAFPQVKRNFATKFEQVLRQAGYESSATTEIGAVSPDDPPLWIKRYPANSCDDRLLFQAKLSGAYDWMNAAQHLVKRAKAFRSHQTIEPKTAHTFPA